MPPTASRRKGNKREREVGGRPTGRTTGQPTEKEQSGGFPDCMFVMSFVLYFTFLWVSVVLSSYLHPQTLNHCRCWCTKSEHEKVRERGRSSPQDAGLSNWSSAHFCFGQCVAGRPLPSSWSHFHCVPTGHELGKHGGMEGESCCCCPHPQSRSKGEWSADKGDG